MKRKVSEMVAKYAGAYISMGESLEDRRNYLRVACSAWNIACHDNENKRKELIDEYLNEYIKCNPNCDNKSKQNVKNNIIKLVSEKRDMFPEEYVTIINGDIRLTDKNKEEFFIYSLRSN